MRKLSFLGLLASLLLAAPSTAGVVVVAPPDAGGSVAGTLNRDGAATPHQLSLVVNGLGGLSQSATASVRVRTNSPQGSWSSARPLHRVDTSNAPVPPWAGGIEDVFAWTFFGLEPCTAYDVELTLVDGVTTDVRSPTTYTTKCLPSEPGAVTATITATANIQSTLNAASPGDHIRFANGTYDMSGITFPTGLSGSAEATPTYITGESRAGVILQETDQLPIINLNSDLSNLVIQDLTLEGSNVDQAPAPSSTSVCVYSPPGDSATNITIRRITCSDVNQGIYFRSAINLADEHSGILIYDSTITGNNLWADTPTTWFTSNAAWDDYGILVTGNGIAMFNLTMQYFGDCFSPTSGGTGERSEQDRSFHVYWNDVSGCLDDFFESDDAYRNLTTYQNYVRNVVNAGSMDPLYGGPWINWGNLKINVAETRMHKWNDDSSGAFFYNETNVKTDSIYRTDAPNNNLSVWYQVSGATHSEIAVVNSIYLHDGGGPDDSILRFESFMSGGVDIHNNAWYPDGAFSLGSQSGANLAAFQAAQPAASGIFESKQRFEDDQITVANPWTTTITMPATYATEVTTDYSWSDFELSASGPQNAGIAVPNITDNLTETFTGLAPDVGANIRGLTAPVVGDQTNGVPAYAQGMAAYDVRQLTGTYSPAGAETMEAVTPTGWVNENNNPGRTFRGVISAYSGGAGAIVQNTADGRLVVHGGGHQDSGNNGFYIFDPRESGGVPVGWEDGVDITTKGTEAFGTTATYSDGRPRSVHTYTSAAYAPDRNLYYRVGGSSFSGPGTFLNDLWEYDPTAAVGSRWTQLTDIPGNSDDGVAMSYDQATGKLIAIDPGAGAWVFDIDDGVSGTWSSEAGLTLFDNFDANGAYDPTRNVMLVTMDNGTARSITFNLTTDTISAQSAITWTGTTNIVSEPSARLYDEDLDVWWFFGGSSTANYDSIAYATGAAVAAGGNVAVTEVALSANMAATGFEEAIIGTFDRYLFVRTSRLIYTVHRTDEAPWIIQLPSSLP